MKRISSEILDFWFKETPPDKWWEKDHTFDRLVKQRFEAVHGAALSGELCGWRETLEGRLAEIIVLDQFSRNMYRGTAAAFASDAQALCLAQQAARDDRRHRLRPDERAFLYMPFMHSESLLVHEQSRCLFAEPGLEEYLPYARSHFELIQKFGRFPHRNAALGRASTDSERQYLAETKDY